MAAEELIVSLPTGEEIVHASDLAIGPAERVLVTGPSRSTVGGTRPQPRASDSSSSLPWTRPRPQVPLMVSVR